jgi:hypothetical protein
MSAQPEPFTPAECDLRGYEWMPLFGARLFASNFEAHASDLAFRIAIKLYWECWQQVPAASLPNDDVQLCRLSGLGRDLKTWRKLRADGVLHGFVLCSDDRLYHGLLADEALKAWECRRRQQAEREGSRERMRRWRGNKTNGDGRDVTRNIDRSCASRDADVTAEVTVARATGQDCTETGTGKEVSKKVSVSNNLLNSSHSAREAAGDQEPDEPEPTAVEIMDRRRVASEALESQAPDIAAHVRRVANANRMRARPHGEVRSVEAQLAALKAQPMAVGADVPLSVRWAPAEPVRSPAEQLVALLGITQTEAEQRLGVAS